jgi:hypothetical protein
MPQEFDKCSMREPAQPGAILCIVFLQFKDGILRWASVLRGLEMLP